MRVKAGKGCELKVRYQVSEVLTSLGKWGWQLKGS